MQFEKDLRIEHTLAGQARAKAEGQKFGRRAALTAEGREKALQRLAGGASISAVAREMNASSLSDSDFKPAWDVKFPALAPWIGSQTVCIWRQDHFRIECVGLSLRNV